MVSGMEVPIISILHLRELPWICESTVEGHRPGQFCTVYHLAYRGRIRRGMEEQRKEPVLMLEHY